MFEVGEMGAGFETSDQHWKMYEQYRKGCRTRHRDENVMKKKEKADKAALKK